MEDKIKELYGKSTNGNSTPEEKEQALNYKDFYNSAIQAYNYKQQANKYLENSLAQSGMAGSGYGSSQATGINNTAYNMYQNAMSNYNQAESDRLLKQDQELATLLNNASSLEEVNSYMKNYGYYQNEDGSYNTNNASSMIKSAYQKSAIDNGLTFNENGNVTSDYSNAKPINSNYEETGTYSYKSDNNTEYHSNIGDIESIKGKTFTVSVGSNDYKIKLSERYQSDSLNPDTIGVGQIKLITGNNGIGVYVTKTKDGKIWIIGGGNSDKFISNVINGK